MKKFSLILLILVSFFVLDSCEGTFKPIVFRDPRDPDITEVFSTIYKTESGNSNTHYTTICWDKDERTDTFVLYRSIDGATLNFEEVYRGEETSFADKEADDKKMYIYRLDKIRGEMTFEGKVYLCSYSDKTDRNDKTAIKNKDEITGYQDNNIQERAYELGTNSSSADFTTYGVKCTYAGDYLQRNGDDADENCFVDQDWYFVTVPKNETKTVEFTGITGATSVMCWVKGNEDGEGGNQDFVVKNQNDTITLDNSQSNEDAKIYFEIKPDTSALNPGDSVVVTYTLEIV